MAVSLQTFSQWLQQQAAAVQASAAAALDLTVGSVLRAILEANASVALWFQWLILQALALTRAATSTGADLDSWMGDFSLTRQPAIPASGIVTFSAITGTPTVSITPGLTVRTGDGTQSFTVTTDTTNSAWDAGSGAYVGALPFDVPVEAVTAGVGGNVLAGTISLISGAVPGADSVTNAVAFSNGLDAESDDAFRARFANYINTRSLATTSAVSYAIQQVQQGLTWTIAENVTTLGAYQPGNFVVTVDDGTGAPSVDLKNAVGAAIEAVRPLGSTFSVQSPTVVPASITFTLTAAAGYSAAPLRVAAGAAVAAYVNGLPLGALLPYSRLAQVAYDSAAGIANITIMRVNGGTADIGGAASQVVRTSSVVVS